MKSNIIRCKNVCMCAVFLNIFLATYTYSLIYYYGQPANVHFHGWQQCFFYICVYIKTFFVDSRVQAYIRFDCIINTPANRHNECSLYSQLHALRWLNLCPSSSSSRSHASKNRLFFAMERARFSTFEFIKSRFGSFFFPIYIKKPLYKAANQFFFPTFVLCCRMFITKFLYALLLYVELVLAASGKTGKGGNRFSTHFR